MKTGSSKSKNKVPAATIETPTKRKVQRRVHRRVQTNIASTKKDKEQLVDVRIKNLSFAYVTWLESKSSHNQFFMLPILRILNAPKVGFINKFGNILDHFGIDDIVDRRKGGADIDKNQIMTFISSKGEEINCKLLFHVKTGNATIEVREFVNHLANQLNRLSKDMNNNRENYDEDKLSIWNWNPKFIPHTDSYEEIKKIGYSFVYPNEQTCTNDARCNNTPNNNSNEDNKTYLDTLRKGLFPDETMIHESLRENSPINEFTSNEFLLCGSFPFIFLFGSAYKRNKGSLLLHQR